MDQVFMATINAFSWLLHTGGEFWSGLFAPLPYGDPYIAALAALLVLTAMVKWARAYS